jgi:hypothetical protein
MLNPELSDSLDFPIGALTGLVLALGFAVSGLLAAKVFGFDAGSTFPIGFLTVAVCGLS